MLGNAASWASSLGSIADDALLWHVSIGGLKSEVLESAPGMASHGIALLALHRVGAGQRASEVARQRRLFLLFNLHNGELPVNFVGFKSNFVARLNLL